MQDLVGHVVVLEFKLSCRSREQHDHSCPLTGPSGCSRWRMDSSTASKEATEIAIANSADEKRWQVGLGESSGEEARSRQLEVHFGDESSKSWW